MMKRLKIILSRLLYPGVLWISLLTLYASAALVFVFVKGLDQSPFAYGAYFLSAYVLTMILFRVPRGISKGKALIYANKFGNRYMTDIPFRVKIGLYLTLALNLAYAVFNLIAGVLYSSFWAGAVSLYYIVLSLVRFLLLRHIRSEKRDLEQELRQYRFCGCFLFALNITLTGVAFQLINGGKSYDYPGFLIYAAAAYAFYNLTAAIIHVIRFRNLNNLVLSASKAINLSAALVSIFALQTAMIPTFGGEETFRHTMNTIVGGMVCLVIFVIAIFMVIKANRKLKINRFNNS